MILALLVLGLMVLFGAGAWQPRHLHPAHEARLRSVGMVSGLLLVEGGLVLGATPLLLRAVGRADLAAACEAMLGGPLPFGDVAGVGAIAAGVLLPFRLVTGAVRMQSWQSRCRVEPWLGAVDRHEAFDLVVLPSGRFGAYAVGGRRPQIVLTRGVIENLSSGCVDAITAHEKAHATNRHHRFITLVAAITAALGWLPPVQTGSSRLRLALERWADEEAALTGGLGRQGVRDSLIEVVSRLMEVPAGAVGFGEAAMVGSRLQALAGDGFLSMGPPLSILSPGRDRRPVLPTGEPCPTGSVRDFAPPYFLNVGKYGNSPFGRIGEVTGRRPQSSPGGSNDSLEPGRRREL